MLYGGKFLARQLLPPLPSNTEERECFSQHTALCANFYFTTTDSRQNILNQWSVPIQNSTTNGLGHTIYNKKKCNESWLGLHYASFHKRQELVCANMSVWNEDDLNETHVFIQLSWSVCPHIVDKYLHQTMNWYFRCNEG